MLWNSGPGRSRARLGRPADAPARRPVDPGQRTVHRGRPRRAARPDAGRRTPSPRPAARRRRARGARPATDGVARPGPTGEGRSRSPSPGATHFDQQYDDLAVQALRFLAETGGDEAVLEFARRRVAFIERDYATVTAAEPELTPAEALAQVFSSEGYAASVRSLPLLTNGVDGRRGRAAVPAALPGLPRRPRVPAAVRGRDRGHRHGPRPPRPAPGHDRPRRRCLHHLHPARHDHQRPLVSTSSTDRPTPRRRR